MSDKVLVLRTCGKDRRSHGGFQWPAVGPVEAPDWSSEPHCGGGLHGLLWGAGDASLLSADPDAVWLVVEVASSAIVDLDGKVKFPRGVVVYCGDRTGAVAHILAVGGPTRGTHWATVTGGDWATVTGGDWATVTGGNKATVTGGDWATVTGGYGATVTGGDGATVTGGNEATVTGGDWATVTGGNKATVTGGDEATVAGANKATVTGGYWATVTGGYEATVTGGDWATVTGGYGATVTGGYGSVIAIRWHDGTRFRRSAAEIDGQEYFPGVAYHVVNGRLVRKGGEA